MNGLNQVDTILRNDTLVADYDYYNFGALKKITYPNQGTSEFSYDNALRLTSQTNSLADSTVVNAYTYEYDLNGNQTKKTDNGNITQYAYDSLGRLQSVSEPDGTNTAYTFDTQGNIMTKTVAHPASYEFAFTQDGTDYEMSNLSTHQFLYAYDKNNQLMMETEHVAGVGEDYAGFLEITKQNEYDNNGNLLKTTKGGQIDESVVEYAYNPLNQLTAYTDSEGAITSYTYNPDGLRSSKTQNGTETKFYWDRGYMSAETIGGTFTAKNYIGATGVFARETSTGTDYMLKNGHGDVTALVNNGVVTQTYDYDAYGVQKNINANDTNPFRYAGEYQDAESGLFYLRARYYDPYVPRFTTMDTHWNAGNMIYGDKEYKESEKKTPNLEAILQANNLYVYALNNPIMYVDPSGEIADWVIVALYTYAQAIITSPDLQYDIEMVAYDISQGDYVSAAFGLVDVLLPAFSGAKWVPKFIRNSWDEVLGVVSKLKKTSIDDVIENAKFVNKTKGNTYIYSKSGGYGNAVKEFESLKLKDVKKYDNGTMVGYLEDGSAVNLHTSSMDGGKWTIEYNNIKIRYEE